MFLTIDCNKKKKKCESTQKYIPPITSFPQNWESRNSPSQLLTKSKSEFNPDIGYNSLNLISQALKYQTVLSSNPDSTTFCANLDLFKQDVLHFCHL